MPGTTGSRSGREGRRYVAIDEDAYKILSILEVQTGKHGSARLQLELEDIFTGQKSQ